MKKNLAVVILLFVSMTGLAQAAGVQQLIVTGETALQWWNQLYPHANPEGQCHNGQTGDYYNYVQTKNVVCWKHLNEGSLVETKCFIAHLGGEAISSDWVDFNLCPI